MASIFDKQNAYEKAQDEFWAERQTQAYQRAQDSDATWKAARAEHFAEQRAQPKDVTMHLSRHMATFMVNALLDKFEEYRRTMPADAVAHYTRLVLDLRAEHADLFPVYDNS